jgi:hypothetical protein
MRILRYLTDLHVIGDGVANPLVELEQHVFLNTWLNLQKRKLDQISQII